MQSAPVLKKLVCDFESYYSTKDCSLRKLSYTDYVNHPDFMVFGAALWWLDDVDSKPKFHNFVDLHLTFDKIDWSSVELIAHNMHFDGYVLHRIYNIHPARYSCTISMSRQIHQGAIKNDLDSLMRFYEVGAKLGDLRDMNGKRVLTPQEWNRLALYCENDAYGTGELYKLFAPQIPQHEHDLIHLTHRLFCKPKLKVNAATAQQALNEEKEEKERLIAATGFTKSELSGDDSFAQILRNAGIEPPTKTSPKTGKEIYAFAKTDQAFIDLLEGEDPVAARLCQVRQAVQSTIGETRAQRLLNEANRGELPVCYLHFGGHTGRLSGGNKTNLQNLTRGSLLRLAIEAAEGELMGVQDSSQIEVRTLYALVGQEDGLAIFRDKRDPYIEMAEFIFKEKIEVDAKGKPITEDGKLKRFIGKCVVLGCGYQMGPPKFQYSLKIGAIGGFQHDIDMELAQQAVYGYRNKNHMVQAGWEEGKALLTHMAYGTGVYESWLYGVSACADTKRILLPGGTWLRYPGLHYDESDRQFKYWHFKSKWRKAYGGKIIENITQAVARNIVCHQMLEIDATVAPVVMMTHDEVVTAFPEDRADHVMSEMHRIMTTPPTWFPNIPLGAEGGYARNYSK